MKLSYIFHSGFVLETEQSILVFDYWMDPSGVMDGVLRSKKPMYVFSSLQSLPRRPLYEGDF